MPEKPDETISEPQSTFNAIQLLNDMGNQIILYGEQCGASGLMDYVDMNCGGIPEGEYAQVVDQAAPEQFLSMYRKVAENRFKLAVTTLIKANAGFRKPIAEFCERSGGGSIELLNVCLKKMDNEHTD